MARLPYGYVPAGRDNLGQRLAEFDPDAVANVRWIFRRVRAGDSFGAIAQALNDAEIDSPQGGAWTSTTVQRIASNPEYLGRERRPRVIGDTVWDATQAELRRRARP